MVAAIPSIWDICENRFTYVGVLIVLFYTLRMFYDCLLHWTGAGPAEHFMAMKRGKLYEEY